MKSEDQLFEQVADAAMNAEPPQALVELLKLTKAADEFVGVRCKHGVPDGTLCAACFTDEADVFDQPPRTTAVAEGSCISALPPQGRGSLDPSDVALFMPDNVYHPKHYSRWKMEPIEFIAINDLPWWLANVIKYTMRFDAKDGLQDLYKARSYLQMKINELEGIQRFWDKPVSQERALKHKDHSGLQALAAKFT